MIDKRVKSTAAPRKRDAARPGKAVRKDNSDRGEPRETHDRPDKPRRFAGPTAGAKTGKPALQRKPKPRKQDPRKEDAKPPRDDEAGMRIAKVMARAGLCSRRDAEAWIEEGRVFLNGKVLTSPAINIGPQDQVSVDGVPLAPRERTRLFLFHKPRGLVTTDKDPEGRRTIFDHLHDTWPDGPRVIAIGRLDINTEGLLLLTNDGGLARVLELPSTGWMRRYRVRANGKTDQAVLNRLRDGLTVDDIDYAGIEATLDRVQGDNVWLRLGLREGKNREIKRVLEHINLFVNRLIRVSFGPFQLGEIPEGRVEEVRTRVLRDQLGPALADEADADFDSPVAEPHRDPAPPPRSRNDARGGERLARGKKVEREEQDRRPQRPRGDRPATGRVRTPAPARAGGTGKRGAEREAPAPVEPSFKPRGPRKHISALRATGPKAGQGERKRSLLSETADRKGRAVVVERKAKVVPRRREEEPAREDKRNIRPGRGASRFKTASTPKPPRKTRDGGKPAARTEAGRRPDGTQASTRKAPPAKPPRSGASSKGTPSKRTPAKGAARGARPAGKPGGRPQRPR